MRILADFHSQALADSLELTLGKRLGHEVRFPTGMEWFYSGNWKIGDVYGEGAIHPARQFLDRGPTADQTGVVVVPNPISFKEFCTGKFDVLIASYLAHVEPFAKLISDYHPQAKLIVQYGNNWPLHPGAKNLLASTAPFSVPESLNVYWYHQEFKLPKLATSEASTNNKKAKAVSFVHAFTVGELFKEDYQDFQVLKKANPKLEFTLHGASCPDGCLSEEQVLETMGQSTYLIHFKTGGDGYGHTLYKAAASGLPVVYKGSQYQGKLASELLTHLETGVDIEKWGLKRTLPDLDTALRLGENIRTRFKSLVNFDKEAQGIKEFLEKLL